MYPEASYEEREKIAGRHKKYQQGLMWTLAYHPRIPAPVRAIVSQWGTCKDEYEREDGWPSQLYIREARRMISDYVMTQWNCEKLELAEDAIGMAAYGMDSHHVQRYVDVNGYVKNEGNVEAHVADPFPHQLQKYCTQEVRGQKPSCSNLSLGISYCFWIDTDGAGIYGFGSVGSNCSSFGH